MPKLAKLGLIIAAVGVGLNGVQLWFYFHQHITHGFLLSAIGSWISVIGIAIFTYNLNRKQK